ncbi:MAG: zinc-ribbon and DUF3426 domain-containing protein [Methylomonas sp.]|nr:zinc-ribbon and DUF3426 domain-containing protein [Methylomonas sp.]PPD20871.1 MAG: hypothetical protein CTY23_07250 [Methylomonas sp.]PPD26355.1 MAG: hypothetical protein CTY22_05500 [Methylomonas sp.]PPD38076.1 MAG: hypothetical protein CTY21_05495 [Methylomonas sp.]PPD40302.1 MAG: hypothetical protein CTY17_06740 [Methylomonas sp.]
MYSRCPHCEHQQTVSTAQLREGRGLLRCRYCANTFDALASLSDEKDETIVLPLDIGLPFDGVAPVRPVRRIWRVANLCVLSLLLLQAVYFERDRWSSVAQAAGFRLPGYYDPAQWSLSHGELRRAGDSHYVFEAVLTNQASIGQSFPALKLTLTDFNGVAVAERIFDASLIGAGELAAGQSQSVHLALIVRRDDIGGFIHSLI